MAKLSFRCRSCGRTHTVAREAAGKKGRCACGKVLVVPAQGETAATPAKAQVVERSSSTAAGKGFVKMGVLYVLLSIPALGVWVYQVFFSGEYQAAGGPDYLTLPSQFWSTVFAALFVGFLFEGWSRLRRRRA